MLLPVRRALVITLVAAAAFAGAGTATADYGFPFPPPGSTSTGSGNASTGSVDTTGSYEGDAFVGSAVLATIIDYPAWLIWGPLGIAQYFWCHLSTFSSDECVDNSDPVS